jgi:Zn finger protein HypA/HybF involved in hydrogenase expression
MHEWGLTRALIKELGRVAALHGGCKILAAKVRISSLAGVSPTRLHRQFDIAAAGSAAEGALLEIEVAPEAIEGRADGVYIETIEIGE